MEKQYTTTGIRRVINATGYSFKGLKAAWKHEAAVRQEFTLAAIMAPTAYFISDTNTQFAVLILSLFIVIITELLNSAVEAVVDRIGPEHHELSGRAKDIASAAVFFSLVQVVCVWGTIIYGNFIQ